MLTCICMHLCMVQIASSPCASTTQQLSITWTVTRQSDGAAVDGLANVQRTGSSFRLPPFVLRATVLYTVTLSVQVVGSAILKVCMPSLLVCSHIATHYCCTCIAVKHMVRTCIHADRTFDSGRSRTP
jgi:hypothetical protein